MTRRYLENSASAAKSKNKIAFDILGILEKWVLDPQWNCATLIT